VALPFRLPRRTLVPLVTIVVALLGLVVSPTAPAAATTPAQRIAKLRAEAHKVRITIDRTNAEIGELVEQYNANTVALERTQAAELANRQRLAEAEVQLTRAQAQLDNRARAIYYRGPVSGIDPFLAGRDFHEVLTAERYQTSVVDADKLAVDRVDDARTNLNRVADQLAADKREQQALRSRLAGQKVTIERRLAAQRAYLTRINGRVRTLVEQERRRQEELRRQAVARRLAAERAARARAAASSRAGGGEWRDAPSRGSSSAGRRAVAYALSQLGSPYVWGASGPGAFDCSGLTMRAWAAAGVSLPRTSRAQWSAGRHLNGMLDLRPGDLLFFGGSPATIHHVGLYMGGGRMIEAPYTGARVRIVSTGRGDFVGAVRP
jgi:peptidoglycan DL-endopeptidase CwlO